jgi:hypothetical protein
LISDLLSAQDALREKIAEDGLALLVTLKEAIVCTVAYATFGPKNQAQREPRR